MRPEFARTDTRFHHIFRSVQHTPACLPPESGVIVLFVLNLAVCLVFSFKNKRLQIIDFARVHPFDAKSGAFNCPSLIGKRLIEGD